MARFAFGHHRCDLLYIQKNCYMGFLMVLDCKFSVPVSVVLDIAKGWAL
jgi:hypothetical protein